MRQYNLKYRQEDAPTDVLSFEMLNTSKELYADVIICADTAKRNASMFGTSYRYELNLYIVHAILHLLGYDDGKKKEKQTMRNREKTILGRLKVKYATD